MAALKSIVRFPHVTRLITRWHDYRVGMTTVLALMELDPLSDTPAQTTLDNPA